MDRIEAEITSFGKLVVPGNLDDPGSECQRDFFAVIARSGIGDDHFLHYPTHTFQTLGKKTGSVANDHRERQRGHGATNEGSLDSARAWSTSAAEAARKKCSNNACQ